jgi:hypothetical protein
MARPALIRPPLIALERRGPRATGHASLSRDDDRSPEYAHPILIPNIVVYV